MIAHLLQHPVGIFRLLDAHDFHLVELMQPVQPPYILAVGPRFAPKAGRVGAMLHRKVLLLQQAVAVKVGHRHFGGRNQVEIIQAHVIHLGILVGQLAGAVS